MSVAYLLIAHGSRDRRSQDAFAALARLVESHLQCHAPQTGVGTAYLELAEQPLHQQIVQFVHGRSLSQLYLFPLFLSPGVHVREDIPAEVAQASTLLTQPCQLQLRDYLGGHPGFVPLLRRLLSRLDAPQRLLLAHGSRRPGGNKPIEEIAGRLNAQPAYWAIAPSLTTQIENTLNQGHEAIAIQPYFLFPGGITTAIAETVADCQAQLPQTQLHLGATLSEAPEFLPLVLDWLLREEQ